MATYECSECGMAVNATCGKCAAPLVDDSLTLDDGSNVQISKCPITIMLWTRYGLHSLIY